MKLKEIAIARSGDKGNHANIGVVARQPADYALLRQKLTEARVALHFVGLQPTRVTRYELPLVQGLNFVLENVLAGGASQSPRIDTQGKLLGTALMELEL